MQQAATVPTRTQNREHEVAPVLKIIAEDKVDDFCNNELLDACSRLEPASVDEPDAIDRQITVIQKMMDERNLDNFSNDALRDACIELVEIYEAETDTQIEPAHAQRTRPRERARAQAREPRVGTIETAARQCAGTAPEDTHETPTRLQPRTTPRAMPEDNTTDNKTARSRRGLDALHEPMERIRKLVTGADPGRLTATTLFDASTDVVEAYDRERGQHAPNNAHEPGVR